MRLSSTLYISMYTHYRCLPRHLFLPLLVHCSSGELHVQLALNSRVNFLRLIPSRHCASSSVPWCPTRCSVPNRRVAPSQGGPGLRIGSTPVCAFPKLRRPAPWFPDSVPPLLAIETSRFLLAA